MLKFCPECKRGAEVCDRCQTEPIAHTVPVDYGSSDARNPMVLCGRCHTELKELIVRWKSFPTERLP